MSGLLLHQDRLIAEALAQFRRLRALVVKLMRRDDRHFFARLAAEAGEFLSPHQAKSFWQVVRRSLPKHKDRTLHPNPIQLECLEEEWGPHFCQLEVGEEVSERVLLQRCARRQEAAVVASPVLDIGQLPTLTEVENVLRSTTPGQSTGLDPIRLAGRFGSSS